MASLTFLDFWTDEDWFYILPNRIYWLLGAQSVSSGGSEVGEYEWDNLQTMCRTLSYIGCNGGNTGTDR